MNTAPAQNKAAKEPPKFIEKLIDKVEEVLTSPDPVSKGEEKPKPELQQQTPQQTSQDQTQPAAPQPQVGVSGGESELELPKGTTITLPTGQAFETKTESKIRKKDPA